MFEQKLVSLLTVYRSLQRVHLAVGSFDRDIDSATLDSARYDAAGVDRRAGRLADSAFPLSKKSMAST